MMTEPELAAFIASQKWTFAKSYPTVPHYWSLLRDARLPAEFHAFVRHISLHGKPMRWKSAPVRMYLDVDGWRYWTMDKDIRDVTLINRQEIAISECKPA